MKVYPTNVEIYSICPKMYEFKKRKKGRVVKEDKGLVFGKKFHKIIAGYYEK